MTRAYLIILLSLLTLTLFGQEENSSFIIKGKLVDADTKISIPLVTIVIVNKQTGISANNFGEFKIPVNVGDEIKFTSIGYDAISLLVTEEMKGSTDQDNMILSMIPAVYDLDSVVVLHLGEDFYLRRKKWKPIEVIGLPKPTENPRDWSKPQVVTDTNGIGIYGLLNVFDKKLQQQKKIKRLQADISFRKNRDERLNRVYNKDIVKSITGIDDRVIEEFMAFCRFSEGEILASSEYDMTVKLLKRYKQFLRR